MILIHRPVSAIYLRQFLSWDSQYFEALRPHETQQVRGTPFRWWLSGRPCFDGGGISFIQVRGGCHAMFATPISFAALVNPLFLKAMDILNAMFWGLVSSDCAWLYTKLPYTFYVFKNHRDVLIRASVASIFLTPHFLFSVFMHRCLWVLVRSCSSYASAVFPSPSLSTLYLSLTTT